MLEKYKHLLTEEIDDDMFETTPDDPYDIFDLYGEIEDELFTEEWLEKLKKVGNIDLSSGCLLSYNEDNGDVLEEITPIGFCDLVGFKIFDSPVVKQFILNYLAKHYSDGIDTYIDCYDIDNGRIDLSSDFLKACFQGDVYDYFYNDYPSSFSEASDFIDDIDEKTLDTLEEMGFPHNIYDLLKEGEEDENHPLSNYYEELKDAFERAVRTGYEQGSADACLNDFDEAINNATPEGCNFTGRDYEKNSANYNITQDFIKDNYNDILENLNYYSTYYSTKDCIIRTFIGQWNDNFDFKEPYYGWNDFNKETFNMILDDNLYEIEQSIKKDKTNNE